MEYILLLHITNIADSSDCWLSIPLELVLRLMLNNDYGIDERNFFHVTLTAVQVITLIHYQIVILPVQNAST